MPHLPLPSNISLDNSSPEKKRVAIMGYTGVAVDLRDMGFSAPLVYNLDGFAVRNNIPYRDEHDELIGHTVSNQKKDGQLITVAEHSVENERSMNVYNAISAGEPYEASMGVEVEVEHIEYVTEGYAFVNNRSFPAPVFVANKGVVDEMTATKKGRDGNTSIAILNHYTNGKDMLMKIQNSAPDQKWLENYKEAPELLIENAKKEKWDEEKFKKELEAWKIKNAPPPKNDPPKPEPPKADPPPEPPSFDWLWEYVDHPVGKTLIKNARKEGWSQEKMDTEIRFLELKNSLPGVPGVHLPSKVEGEAGFEARLAYSIGVSPEMIAKKVGEKAADFAIKNSIMGLREGLMYAANANGGQFNGFGDPAPMNRHLKLMVMNSGFSTIDYPNLMHRVTDYLIEEKWMIDAPQSPAYCREVSTGDFKTTGHIKPKGGKMWEGLDQDGKITHGSHGKEDKYTTDLITIAQILTFKREDIINDDIGIVEDTLDLMLEGATMVPDYMFTNLWYEALNEGVVESDKTHYTLALTKENLKTVYDNVRRRYTDKRHPDKDVKVNGRVNTRWNLVIPPTLEETAWDIIKQDRIVQNDVKGAAGDVGDKNYWFNRLDISIFDNLDNTTYHAGAQADSWGLIPDRENFRPFYIRYLNRQRRPTTERVDLPADELGFGVRGYWDVNEGYRPVENDKLQHMAISVPAAGP